MGRCWVGGSYPWSPGSASGRSSRLSLLSRSCRFWLCCWSASSRIASLFFKRPRRAPRIWRGSARNGRTTAFRTPKTCSRCFGACPKLWRRVRRIVTPRWRRSVVTTRNSRPLASWTPREWWFASAIPSRTTDHSGMSISSGLRWPRTHRLFVIGKFRLGNLLGEGNRLRGDAAGLPPVKDEPPPGIVFVSLDLDRAATHALEFRQGRRTRPWL